MLQGAMAAEGKVGPDDERARATGSQQVLSLLPALQQPTISSLSDEDWVDVNTILDESIVRHIIPRLKSAGARGIVEYSAEQGHRVARRPQSMLRHRRLRPLLRHCCVAVPLVAAGLRRAADLPLLCARISRTAPTAGSRPTPRAWKIVRDAAGQGLQPVPAEQVQAAAPQPGQFRAARRT